MVFGISEKLEMHLLDQPESGMGYQVLVTDSGNFAVLAQQETGRTWGILKFLRNSL